MNDKNKRIISILSIFTIIFTLVGGTLAYWTWTSDTRTGVSFTMAKDFSCSADGGGNITSTNISLEPTICSNTNSAIKRKIVVTPDIKKDGISISMDLWLNINSIGGPLSDSVNLRYVLTTSEESCTEGVISSGNFNGKNDGDKVVIMEKNYSADTTETYYLYLWLDAAETNIATANQTFDFSLGGICSNYVGEPDAPVLDDGMIPVTIANDGKLTIVSEEDSSWYNYGNKEWANVVLVNENATDGVENSHPRSYYQSADNIGQEVTKEDVLAYYVWIPRYKYRISTNTTCGDIATPSIETHPDCYGGPYTLTVTEEEAKQQMTASYNEIIAENPENDWFYGLSIDEIYEIIIDGGLVEDNYVPEEYGIEDFLPSSSYIANLISNRIITGSPTSIDIEFEMQEEEMILGNATTEYRTHPSFWWDHDSDAYLDSGELIPGIWVGKFSTTGDKSNDCVPNEFVDVFAGCDISSLNPTILPEELSLTAQLWPNKFSTSRNISKEGNIYGLDNAKMNAHMMKNSDWGAVAYLSHSQYGINGKIETNSGNMTGCGNSSDCQNKYGTVEVYPQSTTGNISGIFDMSSNTLVMGHYGEEDGFDSMPQLKYYDLYSKKDFPGNGAVDILFFCTTDKCGGHVLDETEGWYNTKIDFVDPMYYFFLGRSSVFGTYPDDAGDDDQFRSVLVPGFGD